LSSGIEDRCGLLLLIGDIGTGKTTICHHLLARSDYRAGCLSNHRLTGDEFLPEVASALGVPAAGGPSRQLLARLRDHLLEEQQAGKTGVLFIDEAHRLGSGVFEELLLLSNVEMSGAPLLQIVLIGQPELLERLATPRLESLNQRIGVRYHLGSMDRVDTTRYVHHRLAASGCTTDGLFSVNALDAVWRASRGTPRLINHVCERSLRRAHETSKQGIRRREVEQIIRNPLYQPLYAGHGSRWSRKALLCCLVLAFAFGVGAFLTGGLDQQRPEQSAVEAPGPPFAGSRQAVDASGPDGVRAAVVPAVLDAGAQLQPEDEPPGDDRRRDLDAVAAETPRKSAHVRPGPEREAGPRPVGANSPGRSPVVGKLNAIAWDEDPGKRMIVLNDEILHEGELFGEVSVVRIQPDHVVLGYRGEQIIRSISRRGQGR
jgi:type II secretory pathway predicted ATPase ExeA